VILVELMVEESISSLKLIEMFEEIETELAPLDGEVVEIVGAVVSDGVVLPESPPVVPPSSELPPEPELSSLGVTY